MKFKVGDVFQDHGYGTGSCRVIRIVTKLDTVGAETIDLLFSNQNGRLLTIDVTGHIWPDSKCQLLVPDNVIQLPEDSYERKGA